MAYQTSRAEFTILDTAKTPRRDYNVAVPNAASENHEHGKHPHHIYEMEITGLLVVAVMLLVLTLVRYWQNINWSAH